MSCSARLPIYIILTGIFFAHYQGFDYPVVVCIGIIFSVIDGASVQCLIIKGDNTPFVMELPPYRMPTAKAIFVILGRKGRQYLKKMGGIILTASIIIWFLGYYPNHNAYSTPREQQEHSYLGMIGKANRTCNSSLWFRLENGCRTYIRSRCERSWWQVQWVFLYGNNQDADSTQISASIRADGITPLGAFLLSAVRLDLFPLHSYNNGYQE
jgi:ferrous iron transport protein B